MIHPEVDFDIYDEPPMRQVRRKLANFQLSRTSSNLIELKVAKGEVEFGAKGPIEYFKVRRDTQAVVNPIELLRDGSSVQVLTCIAIDLADVVFRHTRKVPSTLEFAAEIGGLHVIVALLITCLVGPLQRHSFTMRAIKLLYLAKTEDEELFLEPTGQRQRNKIKKREQMQEAMKKEWNLKYANNRVGKISMSQSIRLFLEQMLCGYRLVDKKLAHYVEKGK